MNLTGPEIWIIGKTLSTGTAQEIARLQNRIPDIVSKWGSRCRTIFKVVPEQYRDQVPDGIAAARELSKFKDKLIECFEKGLITRRSTRWQVDRTYEKVCGKPVAPRHPPDEGEDEEVD